MCEKEVDIKELDTTVREYVKKPIVVTAYQTDEEFYIDTLEGRMLASIGDYIITGVNGEQYPCKPDIFEKTYDLPEVKKECTCELEEEIPKLDFFFKDEISYMRLSMFREIQSRVEFETNCYLFIFFDMGSVKLDINNPINSVSISEDYVEIYNAENEELTFIKTSEIKGFVFEQKPVEKLEDVLNDDD